MSMFIGSVLIEKPVEQRKILSGFLFGGVCEPAGLACSLWWNER
jgi:hypothetical protein